MARKDQIPPFEIMRTTQRERREGYAMPQSPAKPEPAASPVSSGAPDSWISSWWPKSGVPIILRVPRGMAVLILAGVLGLIVLAYGVGHMRGKAAATPREAVLGDGSAAGAVRPAPGTPPATGDDGQSRARAEGESARTWSLADGDPRKSGLNYLILARYPLDEAERLAAFLRGQGVDNAIVPADNARFFHVVALPGFPPDASEARRAFEQQMRGVGRAWKQSNGNRGDDLRTMYAAKFEG